MHGVNDDVVLTSVPRRRAAFSESHLEPIPSKGCRGSPRTPTGTWAGLLFTKARERGWIGSEGVPSNELSE